MHHDCKLQGDLVVPQPNDVDGEDLLVVCEELLLVLIYFKDLLRVTKGAFTDQQVTSLCSH